MCFKKNLKPNVSPTQNCLVSKHVLIENGTGDIVIALKTKNIGFKCLLGFIIIYDKYPQNIFSCNNKVRIDLNNETFANIRNISLKSCTLYFYKSICE